MQLIIKTPVRLVRFLRPVYRNELRRILSDAIERPVSYIGDGCFWSGDCFVAYRQDAHFMWVREPFAPYVRHDALEVKYVTGRFIAKRCV